MSTDEPHARNSDPPTSHEAADSITPEHQRASQEAVHETLSHFGEMPDADMVRRYRLTGHLPQSESGLRTRRHELYLQGRVINTGKKVFLPSGRRAIVWAAV